MAYMVGPSGKVVGIDHLDTLTKMSRENIQKNQKDFLDSGRIKIITGDGRKGYAADAPYDAIHVSILKREFVVVKNTVF